MSFALLGEFWKPLLVLFVAAGAWFFQQHEEREITGLRTTITEQAAKLAVADAAIASQNEAIEKLKAEGAEQQKTIEGLALEAQNNAAKVEVQWKTKYVPQPIPADCSAAVAAGAANAASAAQMFMNPPNR